jgi:uncharacterized protein YndB with AHSA1/START domain
MSRIQVSTQIAAGPEEVWKVIMDPDRLGDWVTIHRKLGKVSDRPLKRRSKLVQTLSLRGTRFKVHWEVSELEANRTAVWDGRGPARSRARTEYRLRPNGDGGTRFDYVNEFKAPLGPFGAVASRALVGGLPEREANKSLARLKSLLER